MPNLKTNLRLSLVPCIVLTLATVASATTKAPTRPLAERVNDAQTVFLGKVINKKVAGDWATADLLVEQPLKNAKQDEKIAVTWRIKIGSFFIYDTAEGTQGVAILKDKHNDRHWLRADKFEHPDMLDQVKGIIAAADKKK